MKGAKGVLINITGGPDMTLFEVDEAANRIRDEVDPDANIIFGSTFDDKLEGRMRISVVATGIGVEIPAQQTPYIKVVSDRGQPLPQQVPAGEPPTLGQMIRKEATAAAVQPAQMPMQQQATGTHGPVGHSGFPGQPTAMSAGQGPGGFAQTPAPTPGYASPATPALSYPSAPPAESYDRPPMERAVRASRTGRGSPAAAAGSRTCTATQPEHLPMDDRQRHAKRLPRG